MFENEMSVNFKKKKITVATINNFYPPVSGAHLRIFHLYKNLSKWFDIEIINYAEYNEEPRKIKISPGLSLISVPKSYKHSEAEKGLYYANKYTWLNLHLLTPEYLLELERSSKESDVVISSHPYSFPAIKDINAKKIWYDSHNVEYALLKSINGDNPNYNNFLKDIKKIEEEGCKASELIMPCSLEDKNTISGLYGIDSSKVFVVPNGTDTDNTLCVLPDERYRCKEKYGINKNLTAFFIGAWWEPNILAVEHIIKLAEKISDVNFIISGYVCDYFKNKTLPYNVKLTGEVSAREKKLLFSYTDIGLNPMLLGSGTNIKMLEYFAYGLPVITTPLGARGLNLSNKSHCIICEIDDFYKAIMDFKKYSIKERSKLAINARKYVESEFNWRVIAERTFEFIRDKNFI